MNTAFKMSRIVSGWLLALAASPLAFAAEPEIVEVHDIAPVWSAHRVGFALLTTDNRQFVAYYDAERHMTIASRDLGSNDWVHTKLPRKTGWDSHNYVTMAVDRDGFLHLSGDMHVVPLFYLRSKRPGDATEWDMLNRMTGQRESRVTYPSFITGAEGELIFTYRDGGSGSGDQLYNVYDPDVREWRRLFDQPFTAGIGAQSVNAYFRGPLRGPDGFFHLCWVWRDTPDCATNHTLSYARSRNLVDWEKGDGTRLELPITLHTADVVDPVPPRGGMINGNTYIGFDGEGRTVIGYHKYDSTGATQIYNARLEDGKWVIYQTSTWTHRWEFQGGGSLPGFDIGLGPVQVAEDGTLIQHYRNVYHGAGVWKLDPQTLKAIGEVSQPPVYPRALGHPESTFPEMKVRWSKDLGSANDASVRYVLRWETLDANRDRPRPDPLPQPTMLRLYALQ